MYRRQNQISSYCGMVLTLFTRESSEFQILINFVSTFCNMYSKQSFDIFKIRNAIRNVFLTKVTLK